MGIYSNKNRSGIRRSVVVEATDNFRVAAVKFNIMNSSGKLIEEGDAFSPDGFTWTYKTIYHNEIITGSLITATASDLPGNETKMELILS